MTCKTCSVSIEPLTEFPGPVCLDCYAASPAGRRVVSADELVSMWGGGRRRQGRR